MRRGRARVGRALVVAVACVLAAGCVSIPSSSSVQKGRAAGAQELRPPLHNTPAGPRPGESRQQIVQGYIFSMLAYPPAPKVVQQFMTTRSAADWDPAAGTLVYENPTVVDAGSELLVKADVLGSLDDRGSWTSAVAGQRSLRLPLRLVKEHGEWRIANPPAGTLVDSHYFQSDYKPFSMYFFDRTRPALLVVPDPVFLLLGTPTATNLVNDLLRGPTADLAGAVTSAAPAGTSVDVSVSVSSNGTVQVPLSESFLKLSPQDRRLFAVQLTWTLKQLSQFLALDVNRIAITVDGRPVAIPEVGVTIPIDAFQYYDPAGLATNRSLYAILGGRLVTVTKSEPLAVPGAIGSISTPARSGAVDPSGSGNLAALVTADGHEVIVGATEVGAGPQARPWLTGATNLLPPSWDVHRLLWAVDRTSRGAVLYAGTISGAHVVTAPGLTGHDVTSIAVSRDGVRLAAIVGHGVHSRLVISVIRRDPEHPRDVTLGTARTVSNPDFPLVNYSGVAWVSPTSVIVLAQGEGDELRPYEFSIDGSSVQPSAGFMPIRPVSIAAGPNADTPTVIGAAEGRLYAGTSTGQWARVGGDHPYRKPFYPG